MEEHDDNGDFFAIGDVHGCASELTLLLNKLPLTESSTVVFLGDYVSRGPSSREVIATILELRKSVKVVALMGNHEDMFLNFIHDPSSEDAGLFIYNGGSATLASYANDDGEYTIPKEHVEFLEGLKLFYLTNKYCFVHAGLPDIQTHRLDPVRDRQTLLWIRRRFHNSTYKWEQRIIHGHTPCDAVEMTPARINVDTGCVFGGRLTAIQLPQGRIFSVPRMDRVKKVYLREHDSKRRAVRFRGSVPVYVERPDELLEFETIDYSELGMYIRDIIRTKRWVFEVGEMIHGYIGSQDHALVRFKAKVLRRNEDNGLCYALEHAWLEEPVGHEAPTETLPFVAEDPGVDTSGEDDPGILDDEGPEV